MSHPQVPLSDLCQDIVVGHVGPSSKHRDSDGIPFLMGKNIGPGYLKLDSLERVSRSFHEREKKSQLRPGDIVVVRIGQSGQAALIPQGFDEANCSGLVVIKKPRESVYAPYLVYYLNSPQGRSASLREAKGSTRSTLNTSSVSKALIPLPPLEEQRRIAAILDKAENINSLLKAQNAVAESFMQSAFIDLFGNPKEEPSNSLFSVTTLGKCCALFSGGTLPDGEENTGQEGGFLLLKVSDMNLPGNEERIKTSKLWASSPGAKSATCPAGSVVIPKRGGAIGTNKKRVVDRDSVLDPNLMAIAPGGQTITTEFLRGWFSFLDLSSITSGSSVPQLNKQDLSPLRVAVPPLQAQERYKKLAIRALSMLDRHQKQSARAHALIAALQRKCFSGNNYE
jgi:type I restriction enzyme S subunit